MHPLQQVEKRRTFKAKEKSADLDVAELEVLAPNEDETKSGKKSVNVIDFESFSPDSNAENKIQMEESGCDRGITTESKVSGSQIQNEYAGLLTGESLHK